MCKRFRDFLHSYPKSISVKRFEHYMMHQHYRMNILCTNRFPYVLILLTFGICAFNLEYVHM